MVCTVGWQTWESRNNYKEKLIAAWIHACIHLGFGRQHGVSHACGRSYKPWMKCENTGNTKTLRNVGNDRKFAPVGPLPGLTGRSGLKVWQLPAPEQVTERSTKKDNLARHGGDGISGSCQGDFQHIQYPVVGSWSFNLGNLEKQVRVYTALRNFEASRPQDLENKCHCHGKMEMPWEEVASPHKAVIQDFNYGTSFCCHCNK